MREVALVGEHGTRRPWNRNARCARHNDRHAEAFSLHTRDGVPVRVEPWCRECALDHTDEGWMLLPIAMLWTPVPDSMPDGAVTVEGLHTGKPTITVKETRP